LKNEISAEKSELRSEINGLSTDLITKMSGMEDRMDTRVREVRERRARIKNRSSVCRSITMGGEARPTAQRQQTRDLGNDLFRARQELEATRRDLENQLAAVEMRTRRAAVGGNVTNASTVKPPKFDGSTSWAVSHRQFQAAATHNNWQPGEKAAHLLSALQGQAAYILQSSSRGHL
jgi:chromosome segregation ATPase